MRLRAASCVLGSPFISRCLFNLSLVFRVPGRIGCSRTASSSGSEHSSLARFLLSLCCLRMCRPCPGESSVAMRLVVSYCTLCVLRVSPNCSMAASSSLSASDAPAVCGGCGCRASCACLMCRKCWPGSPQGGPRLIRTLRANGGKLAALVRLRVLPTHTHACVHQKLRDPP